MEACFMKEPQVANKDSNYLVLFGEMEWSGWSGILLLLSSFCTHRFLSESEATDPE